MAYYSYVNYVGNGELTNFSITFPYLAKTHVKVYVQGILKTHNVHYTFLTASVIQFSSAPLEDETITIQRKSGRDARLVDYTTGSILKEETLDKDSNQLFYLMQEAFDMFSLTTNEDGAVFTSPEAILAAITGQIDVEHLVSSLNAPIGYWDQIYSHDAIYEFNEDGTSVYAHGVLADEEARLTLAEDRIDAIVTDTEGHTAQLTLMAQEFYVKLDGNGNVAGFGLYNGDTSAFVVNVDQFAIIKADGLGDVQYPFVVDTGSGLVAIAGNLLVGGSITAAKIAADAIEASHIGADVIVANHIAIGAVGTSEIDIGAITPDELAANAVTGVKILDGVVIADKIATNAVTAVKIDTLAVTTDKLAALSVSTAKLQVGSATETIIGDGAITTQKVNVDAITANKIATGAVTADAVSTNEIIANTANIKNAVITGAKIVNAEVDTLQIKGQAVTIPVSAFTATEGSWYSSDYNTAHLLHFAGITSTGAVIQVNCNISVKAAQTGTLIRIYRNSTMIYEEEVGTFSGAYYKFITAITDTPGSGDATYYIKATHVSNGQTIYFKNRSIVLLETKR